MIYLTPNTSYRTNLLWGSGVISDAQNTDAGYRQVGAVTILQPLPIKNNRTRNFFEKSDDD